MYSKILLYILLTSLSLSAFAQKKVRLRLNLEPGQSYPLYMLSDQTIDQQVMGMDQKILQKIGLGYDLEVLKASRKAYEIKLTYTRVLYEQDTPMGNVSYISAAPPAEIPPAALGYAGLVNQHFFMRLSPQGGVLAIWGIDEMLDNMLASMAKEGSPIPDEVAEQIRLQYGTEAMQSSMENMFDYYPDKKVRPGDSWTRSGTLTQGMAMQIDATYTLESVENGEARIAVNSQVKTDTTQSPEIANMRMTYDLAGPQSGFSRLNIQTGWIQESSIRQEIDGKVQVDMGTQQMELIMKIMSVITMQPE